MFLLYILNVLLLLVVVGVEWGQECAGLWNGNMTAGGWYGIKTKSEGGH